MKNDRDLSAGLAAAVRAGVIDQQTARRLEPFLATNATPPDTADPDDEKLRLVTGFNDIFVTIGLVMFLGALSYLLLTVSEMLAAPVVAAASWALAEFFTRKRRLALPSIALLFSFVASVFLAVMLVVSDALPNDLSPGAMLAAGMVAALGAYAHWMRFNVPVTVAAGAAALASILLALCQIVAPNLPADYPIAVFVPMGLAVFALAMWFDTSDLTRQTRRTDIAFWLHLLAAPLIVHPILMPMMADEASLASAIQVMIVFLVLAIVALVVDRRAILVSSLAYLAYAAGTLITAVGLHSASFAVSTLAVGAVVLMLSAAWRPLRRAVMALLPASLRARLPAVGPA
ncbi:hypothetical protein [Aestuariivirga sp.]|uniref:hypothetical protein n=1 Tax=Aestuariivirga sp. TaxID=2650926 RepID=UPI0025C51DD2|nr:hypothetical protein [Aestuariivirga sp.]MCA3555175.1 hypothetical protein [Aestuariivirga sp.]